MLKKIVGIRILSFFSIFILIAVAFHPAFNPFWDSFFSQDLENKNIIPGFASASNALYQNPVPINQPERGINVNDLINATPPEHHIDTDEDGLYDSVEAVLGTDYNNSDSDFDGLSDYEEVLTYSTDPLEPDSNFDGIPDYFEVTDVPLDLDFDGTPNAWDADNDGDMVPDAADMSPSSYTEIKSNFHFNITTTGKPTYLDFQIRPSNENNLRLSQQIWNWPYDDEGSMKDLNSSEEDVVIIPTLEFTIPTDFTLTAKHSGHCLEVQNGSMSDGANIQQSNFTGQEHQLWTLESLEDGYYKISPKHNNLCLEVFNASTEEEANVQQSNFTYSDNQLWRLEPISEGYYNIIAKHSGKCLEVDDANQSEGGNVQQNDYWGLDHQLWKLEPIDTFIPSIEDMMDYGIIVNLNKLSVSLSPVYDYGTPVALKGRLFYPSTEHTTIDLDAQLAWKVSGSSDKEVDVLKTSTGFNVSVKDCETNILITNDTQSTNRDRFEIMDLGNDMIAIRAYNGLYVTVLDDENSSLVANSTSIDDQEMFTVTERGNDKIALQAYNDYYVTINSDNNNLTATSPTIGALETFERIDAGYKTEVISLASYKEKFMLTGFNTQENYGSDAAVFYSADENQTLAASFVMAYEYLRNNETTLLDIQQDILPEHNVTVNSTLATDILHMDLAILEVTSNMTPNVLEELDNQTNDKILPIIIALEDEFSLQTMDEFVFGEYEGNTFEVDHSNLSIAIAKYFKVGWYNVSSMEILEAEEFLDEMKRWGLAKGLNESSQALDTYLSIVLAWNVGESRIIRIGDDPITFYYPEAPEVLGTIQSYGLFSLSGLIDIAEWIRNGAGAAYKFLKPTVGQAGKIVRGLQWTYKALNGAKVTKVFKFIGKVAKVLFIIDLVISFVIGLYTWFSFADDHGWSDFGVYVGWLSYMVIINWAGLYAALCILGGPVGALIALILAIFDIIFGIGDIIMGWIIDLFTRIDRRSNIDIELGGNPLVYADDIDDNGIDSGDRIEYKCVVEGNITRTSDGHWGDVWDSYVHPSLTLNVPPNTNWGSTSKLTETIQGYPNYRHETYKLGAWVEPRAMINFPITVKLSYSYRVYYDECFWFFGWWCDRESTSGSSISDLTTMHFDVMPGDLIDFLAWNELTVLDNDGDRLRNDEEITYTANPWHYDTDGDGLWDGFEVDRGTLPYIADSDSDGLGDKLELQLNTDPLDSDTDNDGLTDYVEWRGWLIEFNYFGTSFTMEVFSNPLRNDSDEDGLKDVEEYMKHLNPQSQDTNGNGIDDYNESVFPCFGFITDVSLNGAGNSIRVPPGENITMSIEYRLLGVQRPDTGQPDNCSLVITLNNSIFTQVIYTGTPPVNVITENVTLFSLNSTLDNGSYLMQYYVDWEYGGILPPESQRETIGYIEVNASGSGTIIWDCFEEGTDTDGDFIIDVNEMIGWPVTYTDITGNHTINVTSDPNAADTDGDGLSDLWEHNCYINSTNPRDVDTDHDGLTDPIELIMGTNPLNFDTDGDGLDDATEINFRSNPNMIDTDGDLLPDFLEFMLSSDPTNPDTDNDGLTDAEEYFDCNSSLLLPDSDGDTLFDKQECELGTDPWNPDTDGDGLIDGYEVFIGANPLNADTDADGLEDNDELFWNTNPIQNDTDNDDLFDGEELYYGTNPLHPDSDFDGTVDGEDLDTFAPHVDHIILAYDVDNDVLEFERYLRRYTNVTNAAADEFLSDYSEEQFIVLVGRPDAGNETVGNITKNILTDAGKNVSAMIESDHHRFEVQYGVWTETQTVVMVSHPYFLDHLLVLNILKSRIDTILPDSIEVTYPTPRDQIKIWALSETDSLLIVDLETSVTPWVKLTRYSSLTTPTPLSYTLGLSTNEQTMGRYLELEISENIQNDTMDIIDQAWIRIYYKESDLDLTGDGDGNDVGDINENSLALYSWDTIQGRWVRLTTSLDWVIATGVNTEDTEIDGTRYAGFIWANVSHFCLYGIAGPIITYPWGGGGYGGNYAPIANASAGEPYFGSVGEEIIFDGSLSSDIDGEIVEWVWDFGDGVNRSGEIVNHSYTTPGTYIVLLTVTDNGNAKGTDETIAIIFVANRPPSSPITTGPKEGNKNTLYGYTFQSTDQDNDSLKYIVDWDDGVTNESEFLPNGTIFFSNHSWSKAGRYLLQITVTDNKTESTSDYTVFIDVLYIYVGELGYLVDIDSDGIYDTFYENSTGQQKNIQLTEHNEYLIDLSGDGKWDYIYNIETNTLSKYSDLTESKTDDFLFIIVACIIIFLALSCLVLFRIQRTKKKELKKATKIKDKQRKQNQSPDTKKQSKSKTGKKSKK